MTSAIRQAVRTFKRNRMERALALATGDEIKRANSTLNWREFWHKRDDLRSYPRLMQIGTNWTCNLKCNFCRLTLDSTQKELKAKPPRELTISDKVFDEIMRLMPYPEIITLTPLGEPMLYSKFGKILERHAELGSKNLAMTTNANLINDDRARMLVEGGMSHIFVSVDSADPDIYAGMRVGGTLDKVEYALERINYWKDKLGSELPKMTLASTFMQRNVGGMKQLVDFAVKYKFQSFSVQLMEVENKDLESEFLGYHIDLAKDSLLAALKHAEGKPVEIRVHLAFRNLLTAKLSLPDFKAITAVTEGAAGEIHHEHRGDAAVGDGKHLESFSTHGRHLTEKCHYPWYFLLIDTDGDCRPCCWTAMTFGNLNKLDFNDIWNGPAATQMRRDFLNNHIPKVCQGKHCRVDLDHSGTRE